MAPRKSDLTPLGKGRLGAIHKHAGKGATEQVLPNRGAMSTLARGAPLDRMMQQYSKATPGLLGGASMDTGGDDTGST